MFCFLWTVFFQGFSRARSPAHVRSSPAYFKLNIKERAEVDAFATVDRLSGELFSNLGCRSTFEDTFWKEVFHYLKSPTPAPDEKFFQKVFVDRVKINFSIPKDQGNYAELRRAYIDRIVRIRDELLLLTSKAVYEFPQKYQLSGQALVDKINSERALREIPFERGGEIETKLRLLQNLSGAPGLASTAELSCRPGSGNHFHKEAPGDPTYSREREALREKELLERMRQARMLRDQRMARERAEREARLAEIQKQEEERNRRIAEEEAAHRAAEVQQQILAEHRRLQRERERERAEVPVVQISETAREQFRILNNPLEVALERGEDYRKVTTQSGQWFSIYSDYIKAILETDDFKPLMNQSSMTPIMATICPGFKNFTNRDQMKEAYVAILESISYFESNHRPRLEYRENGLEEEVYTPSGARLWAKDYVAGRDPHSGIVDLYRRGSKPVYMARDTISEGLLQISVKEQFRYGCNGHRHALDYYGDLQYGRPSSSTRAGSSRHYLGHPNKSTLNPFRNLNCGLRMIQKYYAVNRNVIGETAYPSWSTLSTRSGSKLRKTIDRAKRNYPRCR